MSWVPPALARRWGRGADAYPRKRKRPCLGHLGPQGALLAWLGFAAPRSPRTRPLLPLQASSPLAPRRL